jgi:hypothetical protein
MLEQKPYKSVHTQYLTCVFAIENFQWYFSSNFLTFNVSSHTPDLVVSNSLMNYCRTRKRPSKRQLQENTHYRLWTGDSHLTNIPHTSLIWSWITLLQLSFFTTSYLAWRNLHANIKILEQEANNPNYCRSSRRRHKTSISQPATLCEPSQYWAFRNTQNLCRTGWAQAICRTDNATKLWPHLNCGTASCLTASTAYLPRLRVCTSRFCLFAEKL